MYLFCVICTRLSVSLSEIEVVAPGKQGSHIKTPSKSCEKWGDYDNNDNITHK